MKSINQFIRLLHINYVLAKNGLDNVIVSVHLLRAFRFIVFFNPWNWFRRKKFSRGEALRKSFEELGPVFIKFGQALSTRPDLIPPDIIMELKRLQDNVPPFPNELAELMLEKVYKKPITEVFAHFEKSPFASASISQVHGATLKTGEDVIVKVLRPGIKKLIRNDIGILHVIANLAHKYWPQSKLFKPKEIVQEFERTIIDELDLRLEAANAQLLRRNFDNSKLLYVPQVYWDYVHSNILVTERIYGIAVTDTQKLNEHNVNIKKLAERGLEIFFTQVFRDRFFHADMHPGNIFVSYDNPLDPQYICVDFGIVGALTDSDKMYLAENLLAFFNRDYQKVAALHLGSGWMPADTNRIEFENAIRTVCEPIFEKPLKDISFATLIIQLFRIARRFDIEIQPQLILLQKTLLAIEGLGRQLYPNLDIWSHGKPFMEKWVREQLGLKGLYHNIKHNWPFMVEKLPYIPQLLNDVLTLQKKQLEIKMLEVNPVKTNNLQNSRKGLSLGICVTVSAFAGLLYFNILSHNELFFLSLGAAVSSGLLALISD